MGASQRIEATKQSRNVKTVAVETDYALDGDGGERGLFDWAEPTMDTLAATVAAVLGAGDMISFTMDRNRTSVLVTLTSGKQQYRKWCNTPYDLDTHLIKVYDRAIQAQNRANPPTLPL